MKTPRLTIHTLALTRAALSTRNRPHESAIGRAGSPLPAAERHEDGAHGVTRPTLKRWLALCLLASVLCLSARAQGNAFTYQGRLNDGANPAGGIYDLRFAIYDSSGGGVQQGPTLTNAPVNVSNGLFTVTLDFGANFPGADRWLEIAVRTNGGGAFATLIPRQPITATPYAITAGNLSGALPSASLSGTYANAVILNNGANSFSGNGTGLTNVNAISLGGFSASSFWNLGGNAGTTPGTYFVGTTDNQPLELKVNNQRGLRLEPMANTDTVNVIGGSARNFVGAGAVGATIGGGGAGSYYGAAYTNRVEADFGTVSGGFQNTIQTNAGAATIGGGFVNTIESSAGSSTIAGGNLNSIQAGSVYSAIGGGLQNTIQTNASYATIGGGRENTIQPNAIRATLGGGYFNTIQNNASYATIGGGYFNTIQTEAYYATIGGGAHNTIQTIAWYATLGGGDQNTIQNNARYATLGGGYGNIIQNNANYTTIGGGYVNTIQPGAQFATVPGGRENSATNYAFAAGYRAKANHTGAFVWADSAGADFASTANNQFLIRASGGVGIGTDSPATRLHVAGDTTINGVVNFGNTTRQMLNLYNADYGIGIQALTLYFRTEPNGGFAWHKGGTHHDGQNNPGGGTTLMRLDNAGQLFTLGAINPPSDRNAKENFKPVDPRAVLDKVAALPLSEWNYKADTSARHLGPMAQDFYAAFAIGTDDKHIATVDADGVALAAIQGLNQKVEEQRSQIEQKQTEITELKQSVAELKALVRQLAAEKNGGAK